MDEEYIAARLAESEASVTEYREKSLALEERRVLAAECQADAIKLLCERLAGTAESLQKTISDQVPQMIASYFGRPSSGQKGS